MVDFNIDTSSYPKVQQQNPLDTIDKLQSIQGKGIANQRAQLQLMNERYQHVSGYFSRLLGQDNISDKDIADRAQELVKAGIMTPEQYAQHVSSVPSATAIKRQYPNATPDQVSAMADKQRRNWLTQQALKAEDNHNAMNWYMGEPSLQDVGGGFQPIRKRMGGIEATGPVVPQGLPRTTEGFIPGENRVAPIGANQPNSPGLPVPGQQNRNPLPVTGSTAPIVPNRVQTVKPPPLPIGPDYEPINSPRDALGRPQNITGTPNPIPGHLPPLFEEGKKQLAEDSANASARLQALKPAQQALKLMDPEVIKGLSGTGPIAEKATKILSALQGVGLLNTTEPVAARQELVKKLAQYVGNNPVGQRSDAAQTLAEAGSPNPNVQVLPALINLTRDSIALDRVNAAKALAFNDKDFSKYISHKANFPNSIDERAFKLDIMDDKEREQLREQVKKESKSKQEKFKQSVELAKRLKMYE